VKLVDIEFKGSWVPASIKSTFTSSQLIMLTGKRMVLTDKKKTM